MDGVKFPLLDAQLFRMTDAYKKAIQSALRRKTKRTGVTANWKKTGSNSWKPYNIRKRKYTANRMASGFLHDNTKVIKMDVYEYAVTMPWYVDVLINGRKKGKGIPVKVMDKWIKKKKIKPRGADGKFKSMSRETLGYLMNRKIKYFGIEGENFIAPERNMIMKNYKSAITRAINKDINNLIK